MAQRVVQRRCDGWTLVELMIALALAALTVSLALPGYRDWIATYQLASHAEQLAGSLALARAEAIKRGLRVNLCRAADGRRCTDGAGWEAGWLVYVDADRDGRNAGDEPVLRVEGAAPAGSTCAPTGRSRTTSRSPVSATHAC